MIFTIVADYSASEKKQISQETHIRHLSNWLALNFSLGPPHISTKSMNSEWTLSHTMPLLPDITPPSSTWIGFSISDITCQKIRQDYVNLNMHVNTCREYWSAKTHKDGENSTVANTNLD